MDMGRNTVMINAIVTVIALQMMAGITTLSSSKKADTITNKIRVVAAGNFWSYQISQISGVYV
jgi:hypothetical protein